MFDKALFCKSFDEDFPRLSNLINSYEEQGCEIPFIVSIPRSQEFLFANLIGRHSFLTLIFDEDYTPLGTNALYGWISQQICKLSIHKTKLARAYFSVDSDAYLINPLGNADFFTDGLPKIVYSQIFTKFSSDNLRLIDYLFQESRDLDPKTIDVAPPVCSLEVFAANLVKFRSWLTTSRDKDPFARGQWINELFNVQNGIALQPGQILHASLLDEMESFFAQFDLTVFDLISLIPWEYNWYGCWASALSKQSLCRSTSPIIHFDSDQSIASAKAMGITPELIKTKFKVIQMAARHFAEKRFS